MGGLCSIALLTSGCDTNAPSDSFSLALSEDGRHIVVEQEWALPMGADRGDVLFDAARVSPGNAVTASLSSGDHAIVLSSTYARGQHQLGVDVDGLDISRVELFLEDFDHTRHLIAAAQSVAALPHPTLGVAPQSIHYDKESDADGNEVIIISYDYHEGGAVVAEYAAPQQEGETARATAEVLQISASAPVEAEYVGYRLFLDSPVPGWSRLRVSGYDELGIESASFAFEDGKDAPSRASRRHLPASYVEGSMIAAAAR